MKIDLLAPGGELTVDVVQGAVGLVDAGLCPRTALELLTPLELALVYDWAMREHLGAAGNRIRRRPRPACHSLAIRAGRDTPGLGHRVRLDFVLCLPPGSAPPTPTVEAIESAALAMSGPGYELLPGHRIDVGPEPLSYVSGEMVQAQVTRQAIETVLGMLGTSAPVLGPRRRRPGRGPRRPRRAR